MPLSPRHLVVPIVVVLLGVVLLALDTAAVSSCADADDQRENHRLTQAGSAYTEILETDPGSGCATTGMRRVVTRLCTRARKLAAKGATESAAKAYAEILKLEPLESIGTCPGAGLGAAETTPTKQEPTVVRGPRGLTGARGPAGKPGTDGKNGKGGTDGKNGTPGTDGKAGKPGADGKDGKDGKDATVKPWTG